MKGYVVKKDSTINEWKELYLVLNNLSVCLYLNDTCVDLCVGYDLDKNSFVHCIPQYENQSYLVKLDLISFHGEIDSVYFSLDSSKNQAEWFKAIAESILDSLQLLSLRDIWSIDFQPIAKIHSSYPTNRLSDRTVVLFSAASNRPKVVVLSRSDSAAARLYSLLLVNTDHSSLKESSKDGEKTCTYLNWAVMNATRGDVSTGYEVASYQIQQPPSAGKLGRHYFLLFGHEDAITAAQSAALRALASRREHFSIAEWAACLGATSPSAVEGFDVQWEEEPSGAAEQVANGGLTSPAKSSSINPSTPLTASRTVLPQPRSALKKNAPGNSPRADPSVVSSPAKKLMVTFMIVHPTLMSDSLVVSPSFYEGLEHEQPLGSETRHLFEGVGDEEDGGSVDDLLLPDYQVEYAAAGHGGHSISSHNMVSRHAVGGNSNSGSAHGEAVHNSVGATGTLSIATIAGSDAEQSPRLSPTSSNTNSNSSNPAGRQVTRQASDINMTNGNGSNRSLVPLMQRVGQAQRPQDFLAVFGVSAVCIFEGEMMRKKFSGDYVMKESFVWIEPASKSIHWARSATQKNVKHKHILLDKNSSYNLVGSDGESLKTPPTSPSSSGAPPFVYKRTAGGSLAGVIKGAELEDLTITITTESNQRLKIKIPPGSSAATLRAKEWFKVIKLLTQDTAK